MMPTKKIINRKLIAGFTPTPNLALFRFFNKFYLYFKFLVRNKNQDIFASAKQKALPKLVSGFTLIEIMVAISIFSMVILVAMGSILSIVAANKKAQALNSVINNLNFSLESMVRDLRTGSNYNCGGNPGVFDCSSTPKNIIAFDSSQYGGRVVYRLRNNNEITRSIDGGTEYQLTASEIKIETLDFYVADTAKPNGGNYNQPKILVVIGGIATSGQQETEFHLQTLVSQRLLDIND